MSYLEREGQIQLKPVNWQPWEKNGHSLGVKFDFVTKEGESVNGAFGWTKKNGDVNPDIQELSDAFEAQKSVLMEVQKGAEKANGGHFYNAKWIVRDPNEKRTASDLKAYTAKVKDHQKAKEEAKESAPQADDGSIPF